MNIQFIIPNAHSPPRRDHYPHRELAAPLFNRCITGPLCFAEIEKKLFSEFIHTPARIVSTPKPPKTAPNVRFGNKPKINFVTLHCNRY